MLNALNVFERQEELVSLYAFSFTRTPSLLTTNLSAVITNAAESTSQTCMRSLTTSRSVTS